AARLATRLDVKGSRQQNGRQKRAVNQSFTKREWRVPMMRPLVLLAATFAVALTAPVRADVALDELARDLDRTESIRAVKTLQSSYAQYAQFGLWNEVGALFAEDGS